jgi:hypothetical protein
MLKNFRLVAVASDCGASSSAIPIHCDTTVNLYDYYYVVRNDRVEAIWPVAARGYLVGVIRRLRSAVADRPVMHNRRHGGGEGDPADCLTVPRQQEPSAEASMHRS